jgi:hypothetical protein
MPGKITPAIRELIAFQDHIESGEAPDDYPKTSEMATIVQGALGKISGGKSNPARTEVFRQLKGRVTTSLAGASSAEKAKISVKSGKPASSRDVDKANAKIGTLNGINFMLNESYTSTENKPVTAEYFTDVNNLTDYNRLVTKSEDDPEPIKFVIKSEVKEGSVAGTEELSGASTASTISANAEEFEENFIEELTTKVSEYNDAHPDNPPLYGGNKDEAKVLFDRSKPLSSVNRLNLGGPNINFQAFSPDYSFDVHFDLSEGAPKIILRMDEDLSGFIAGVTDPREQIPVKYEAEISIPISEEPPSEIMVTENFTKL